MNILFTTKLPLIGFENFGNDHIILPEKAIFSEKQLLQRLTDCDVLVPTFDYPIPKFFFDNAPRLKLIANAGVGFNNIDLEEANRRKIPVTNTPLPVIEPTAEHAMALMLAVARRIPELDRKIRFHEEITFGVMNNLGKGLNGKTLGIIGMGRIGKALAKRANAFGMKIVYHNRHPLDKEIERQYRATYVSLNDLLQISDFISLNTPFNADSYHLINEGSLNLMKNDCVLVNTSRGAVIDERALIAALDNGKLYGVGLDVFEHEPQIPEALCKIDRVVLSPHVGTGTIDCRKAMVQNVANNIGFFKKHQLDKMNIVNPF